MRGDERRGERGNEKERRGNKREKYRETNLEREERGRAREVGVTEQVLLRPAPYLLSPQAACSCFAAT
jgi:hypothetical protein